ncbi:Asp-tRNA(Asn)/Glu-tRNA(Gln) amidotransferase subunit GatA [Acinetobacter baumannii]|jgi:aspartyl-tRNA(Asn)/glutamyl-tRNA(Gln) amidotransferase subunit A|uniref:Asp-tRNA(Asn)/Glu-tRNA(Gln) amidotransferase subunit GatA n=1 Tax=Acinetobacter TaxID=469 RepID=UPI0007074D3A|nr:Asp-tRNA(Asn)/Glu-tRNA(Gln) amidotransferase subunit GatA [Acinetobacter baumannii]EHU1307578.1 Asp-tRNA(Asn)/Glu-tRNA(Gln) amidotransferase subunit GatA [Acinetobacter baumannii]EHU1430224.1 Asp-tRNA(Asn)/Glu-tRNA(Gln) amidotransferase subunit GatA [Acinetobacter baumannii]EHU2160812.1 Asp-tRNA(Asn)/Glu-tRNA(Gln) amidotransferase subunit GatA [Acinetobacter baumannii]EHU2442041.1 Asp-tRNA(Asn)/Glu-tRNA(Gln) amidotransferase subunit GatA [Acinetobacter baumannii]EIB6850715.1 Asp-tRNA(Asn)/G
MTDLHRLSIRELAEGLSQAKFSSRELTEHYLKRIAKIDPQVKSYVTVTPEQALREADAADAALKAGNATALTGIPLAHKDIFCTKGIKTTAGSKMLDNFISPYDATVVEKTKAAGLVTLGKVNMDEFAMGSTSESSYVGATSNPWALDHVPGGSSGGSAAAVAADLAPFATGTDTGGSIRQPASFCGLTGLKPTYGRVSRFGIIAYASSLDQAGPMAHSAEDCAYLMNVIAGHDAKDSTSVKKEVDDYVANLNNTSVKGLRIGIPKQYFNVAGLDADVKARVEESLKKLEEMGAALVEIDLNMTEAYVPTYYLIAPAEASSNLSRYDGVRYGYRCENPADLMDLYKRSRSEGFGPEVQRRILIGTYALSAGYYDAYYVKAQKVRRLIQQDFLKAFENVDVIAAPAAPTTAYKIGASLDPVEMYLGDIYTIAVNLAGLPAINAPVGFDKDNLPVGLQLIGNYWSESQLLSIVHQYQQNTDWHTKRAAIAEENA